MHSYTLTVHPSDRYMADGVPTTAQEVCGSTGPQCDEEVPFTWWPTVVGAKERVISVWPDIAAKNAAGLSNTPRQVYTLSRALLALLLQTQFTTKAHANLTIFSRRWNYDFRSKIQSPIATDRCNVVHTDWFWLRFCRLRMMVTADMFKRQVVARNVHTRFISGVVSVCCLW